MEKFSRERPLYTTHPSPAENSDETSSWSLQQRRLRSLGGKETILKVSNKSELKGSFQSAYTFYKHPEESGEMEISGEDQRNTPGELQAGVAQCLDRLDGLHHRRGDPAGVRQDEGQEEVGVNLISQTAHFPGESERSRTENN